MPESSRRLTDKKSIYVSLTSPQRLLEEAARQAIRQAAFEFGIDENGHSSKVKEWERSCCSIEIEFVGVQMSGGMGGWQYNVVFRAWCEKHSDDY